MRISKDSLLRVCYSKGVSHCHLAYGRDSKADTRLESFRVYGKKGKSWDVGGFCHGEAVSVLT